MKLLLSKILITFVYLFVSQVASDFYFDDAVCQLTRKMDEGSASFRERMRTCELAFEQIKDEHSIYKVFEHFEYLFHVFSQDECEYQDRNKLSLCFFNFNNHHRKSLLFTECTCAKTTQFYLFYRAKFDDLHENFDKYSAFLHEFANCFDDLDSAIKSVGIESFHVNDAGRTWYPEMLAAMKTMNNLFQLMKSDRTAFFSQLCENIREMNIVPNYVDEICEHYPPPVEEKK